MSPAEKEELKANILREKQALIEDIERLEELTKPIAPDNAIGRLTRMDAINNRSINQVGLNSARVKLRRLEEMLATLNHSDFGLCTVCRESIPVERLMLVPESDRCVRCA